METAVMVERFLEFTKDSLSWCSRESEESTSKVSGAIDSLLRDTARVSELSGESVSAIEGMQGKLKVHFEEGSSVTELIKTLKELADDHDEIKNVIHPIIQSLQFQDRLRQNLENIGEMIGTWIQSRQAFESSDCSEQQLLEFGEALIKNTTMKEERDFVRDFIPGLPEEEVQDSVLMF